MPYTVYILQSQKDRKYYIGCTKNIAQRLHKHNTGRVFSTKPYTPWRLVYEEEYNNLSDARQRETQLKRWKSRKAIVNLCRRRLVWSRTPPSHGGNSSSNLDDGTRKILF